MKVVKSVFVILAFAMFVPMAQAQEQEWLHQFGTSSGDHARAVAPATNGGVIVAGSTGGSLGGPQMGSGDVFLARYDSLGNQVWITQFGTSSGEIARALAPDGHGGVFIAGSTRGSLGGPNSGFADVWVARYDNAGNRRWIRQFGTNSNEDATALATNSAGDVWVTGWTDGALGGPMVGGKDAYLARYDNSGNRIWIRQFGSFSTDEAWALAPDGAGGVMVAGWTRGSLGGPNAVGLDAWIVRYDTAGSRLWGTQFGTSSDDVALGLASDGAGGVMVAGHTWGSLGGPNAGYADAFLARYSIDSCYADCDQSTGNGVLDIFDFLCFQNSFVNGEPYACDCDTSTGPLVCDIFDFLCFQDAFVGGCP